MSNPTFELNWVGVVTIRTSCFLVICPQKSTTQSCFTLKPWIISKFYHLNLRLVNYNQFISVWWAKICNKLFSLRWWRCLESRPRLEWCWCLWTLWWSRRSSWPRLACPPLLPWSVLLQQVCPRTWKGQAKTIMYDVKPSVVCNRNLQGLREISQECCRGTFSPELSLPSFPDPTYSLFSFQLIYILEIRFINTNL